MAAHLRPREQANTDRGGRSDSTRQEPAAVKCSGLILFMASLGGALGLAQW